MRDLTDPSADRQAPDHSTLSIGSIRSDVCKFFAAELTDAEIMDIGAWATTSLRASLGRGVSPAIAFSPVRFPTR